MCNYFLLSSLPFCFINGFWLEFDIVPIVYFCFCCLCFWFPVQTIIANTDIKEFSPYVFFQEFYTFRSGLIFKSLVPFELIFGSGIRQGFNFILFHEDIQFPKQNLLKRPILYLLTTLASFVKYELNIYVYFWVLNSVPLLCVSVLCQYCTVLITIVLQHSLKLGSVIPPALFFVKIAVATWDPLQFHNNFRIIYYISV